MMTSEEFKRRWNSDETGGRITYEDVANVAVAWGLYQTPRIHRMDLVLTAVLEAAGCELPNVDVRGEWPAKVGSFAETPPVQ